MPNIAGFWSYVQDDNEDDGQAILNLADRLRSEYSLLSGEKLTLFTDREIAWGEEWKRRIDQALQDTTFFIPIITPRYFKSEECRRELVEFKTASEEFGVEQLLLPIYYIEVPEMEVDEPDDKLMSFVKKIQREDLRKLRLKNEADSKHREMVNALASRLLKIAQETEAEPALQPEERAAVLIEHQIPGSTRVEKASPNGHDDENGAEAGSLEVLAAGEEALPAWAETIGKFNEELEAINEAATQETKRIEEENASGSATFAGRLAGANRLAKRLDGPAENLTELGREYSEQLLTVDPAIQTLIRMASEDEELRNDPGTQVLFKSVKEMANASRKGMAEMVNLADAMAANSGFSRELRRPLRRMETALRNISDGQEVVDNWERKIDQLLVDGERPDPSTED